MKSINQKAVVSWLFIGVFLILLMVGVGGSVRLTNSGLSIVEWKPITGIIPPMNEAEWQKEFDEYKKIPEYKIEHKYFELNDFKKIFLWEYIHRLIARLVGFIFIIPFLIFWYRGHFKDKKLFYRILFIFFFASFQAWLGWFMVKSGLSDRIDVSHYRLAIHLFIATLLASYVLWTALGLKYIKKDVIKIPFYRKWILTILGLLSFQLFYGAFTAGLNAGYYYPQYPKMGTEWFPTLASQAFGSIGFISFISDPSMVHFIHRWFAVVVLFVISIFYLKFYKKIEFRIIKILLNVVLGLIVFQFVLGIITVLTNINIIIAVLHQVNAILLFLSLIWLLFHTSKNNG